MIKKSLFISTILITTFLSPDSWSKINEPNIKEGVMYAGLIKVRPINNNGGSSYINVSPPSNNVPTYNQNQFQAEQGTSLHNTDRKAMAVIDITLRLIIRQGQHIKNKFQTTDMFQATIVVMLKILKKVTLFFLVAQF